ncbi:phage/plasmid primase, P4 family [Oceanirhabdus sp. W0125-5]|uniref:phage/plasmid primase, P4 family n=1 Tax=Oceanirhabdus sp. W0125-5 TaxID=2999116 RepID=UPI0022F2FCC6|nr:phage/plasmid primase, P4 family [Oceanirhabdus sp. W0125-5]WBW97588.1 phage/plasmid primase, P4 family [Oceanirhabdus sp. W0125-5]
MVKLGKKFTSIIENKLFPMVPLVNYKKVPVVSWSNEDYWVKSEEEEVQAIGQITGFSLICGKPSNIMVIDIDKNHGDGSINGFDSFNKLIKELSKEDKERALNTLAIKTPRGGMHLYFKYKEGLKSKANYVPGVDIKTDGGLIVLPNSKVRINGEVKQYIANSNVIHEMPQVLFDKLIELDKVTIIDKPSKKKKESYKTKDIFKANKYYKPIKEGEGRDNTLISWLGYMIKNNPTMRKKEMLLPQAIMYNDCWFKPPLQIEEVEKKVDSVLKYALPSYCDEKGKINNWALVQHIIKEQPSYTKGNLWFLYDNEKGFYRYMEFKEVQKMFFQYAMDDKDKTVTKSKNFADLLMLNSEDARKNHDEKKYINCLNGIIDIQNNELMPHESQYKTEVQFQANYIEQWEDKFNNSEFKKYLTTTLDDGSIITLQESWGLMLSPHSREVQNCFIYKGEGSNGKSLAFDIQEALIGDNRHICGIGLGDFGGDFTISVAEGKHVNIVRDDELSGKTVNKFFKSMVCGEPVTVNRKNKDLVRLGFNMTMFFGLNRLPSASDKSTGFFRRPIIIPFNISFGSEKEVKEGTRDMLKDTGLAQRIIDNELDIVFMWAYEGLKRVKANKWKVTVSEAAEQEMEEYREEVDSAYAFFKEKVSLVPKQGKRVPKGDVYRAYESWCFFNNIMSMNPTHFGRQLLSFGVKQKKSNSVGYYLDIEITDMKEMKSEAFVFK